MSIKSDGIFVIQKGQGITQGIAQEIGLSQEQIRKIDKSVWSAILDEIAKEKEINPICIQAEVISLEKITVILSFRQVKLLQFL